MFLRIALITITLILFFDSAFAQIIKSYPIDTKKQIPIHIGDTVYVLLEYHNNTDKTEYLQPSLYNNYIDLYCQDKDEGVWQYYEEVAHNMNVSPSKIDFIPLPAHSTIYFAKSFQFPPLEDIQDNFWRKGISEIKETATDYPLKIHFHILPKILPKENRLKNISELIIMQNVVLKSRTKADMELVEKWYQNTPVNLFPTLHKDFYRLFKVSQDCFQKDNNVIPQIHNYSALIFMSHKNRYPNTFNAPETWRGWKDLEERISPSTMRDEIRLTRMLIQYCDTKDKKVLEDLKEWFANMNEVQRIVMAKNVFNRVRKVYDTKELLPLFCDFYKTIQKYDISAKQNFEKELLKKLGLLEE